MSQDTLPPPGRIADASLCLQIGLDRLQTGSVASWFSRLACKVEELHRLGLRCWCWRSTCSSLRRCNVHDCIRCRMSLVGDSCGDCVEVDLVVNGSEASIGLVAFDMCADNLGGSQSMDATVHCVFRESGCGREASNVAACQQATRGAPVRGLSNEDQLFEHDPCRGTNPSTRCRGAAIKGELQIHLRCSE